MVISCCSTIPLRRFDANIQVESIPRRLDRFSSRLLAGVAQQCMCVLELSGSVGVPD